MKVYHCVSPGDTDEKHFNLVPPYIYRAVFQKSVVKHKD